MNGNDGIIKRRQFLKASIASLSAVGLYSGCKSLEAPGAGAPSYAPEAKTSAKGSVLMAYSSGQSAHECSLGLYDWDADRLTPFPNRLPFAVPHSVVPNKLNKDEFFVFEVYGKIAKVNVATGEITRLDRSDDDVFSHGHGIQPDGGELLFSTEMTISTHSRYVAVRSAETLKVVDRVPRELGGHHIIQVPKTSLLVCSSPPRHGNAGSTLYFYDYKKQKVVRSLELEHDVVHLTARPNGEVLGVCDKIRWSKPFKPVRGESSVRNSENMYRSGEFLPAPAFVVAPDSKPRLLWDEKHKEELKFGFGISALETRLLTTYMDSNSIVLWRDQKIEKIIPMERPQLAMFSKDGSEFMVVGAKGISIFTESSSEALRDLTPPGGGQFHIIGAYA